MTLYFLLSNLTFALPPADKSIASPRKQLRDARWSCTDADAESGKPPQPLSICFDLSIVRPGPLRSSPSAPQGASSYSKLKSSRPTCSSHSSRESPASASTHLPNCFTADPPLHGPASIVATPASGSSLKLIRNFLLASPISIASIFSLHPARPCCCGFLNHCRTVPTGHSLL